MSTLKKQSKIVKCFLPEDVQTIICNSGKLEITSIRNNNKKLIR